jgi:hypothetical protein
MSPPPTPDATNKQEFSIAGAFGKWLFVNIQNPGITFAITGPWKSLGL